MEIEFPKATAEKDAFNQTTPPKVASQRMESQVFFSEIVSESKPVAREQTP